MEFIDINPFVRLAEKIVYMPPQNFIFKAYDCRLLYIIEGTDTLCLNDIDHSFSQNDMFYFKEATSYSFTCTGELMLYVFNFDMG